MKAKAGDTVAVHYTVRRVTSLVAGGGLERAEEGKTALLLTRGMRRVHSPTELSLTAASSVATPSPSSLGKARLSR